MKSKPIWLIVLVVVLVTVTVVLYRPSNTPPFAIPPALKSDEIKALPEFQLLSKVTTDLRFKVASEPRHAEHWRMMSESARNVLALSWLEDDLPPDAPASSKSFQGFAILLCNHSPNMATLDEMAAAYEAIGAPKTAEAVKEAKAIAESPEGRAPLETGDPVPHFSGSNPFDKVDRKFRDQKQGDKTVDLLRAYIRAHVDDIASTHM